MPRRNNHRPVLSQIRLKNFKSVKETEVDLKLLTVVVGKNSSGKSTLLQSILVLVQAVSKRGRSRSFPLNGEFVKLGSFNEVKNFSDENKNGQILLGFTVNHTRVPRQARVEARRNPSSLRRAVYSTSTSWDGYISGPNDQGNGFALIDGLQLKVETSFEDKVVGRVSVDIAQMLQEIDHEHGSRSELFNPVAPRELNVRSLVHKVDGRFLNGATGESSSIDVASLQGGLPWSLYKSNSKFEYYAKIWWDAYSEILEMQLENSKKEYAAALAEGKVKKVSLYASTQAAKDIRGLTESGKDEDSEIEVAALLRGLRRQDEEFFKKCAANLKDSEKESIAKSMIIEPEATFRRKLKTHLKEEEWDEIVHSEIEEGYIGLKESNFFINNFFSWSVKYLGPLRQEPKPVYDPGPEREDLGIHGEYTAGVLLQKSQQKQKRAFPLPDGRTEKCTFSEALGIWLNNFDLVREANATDRGRLGIGLEVVPLGTTKSVDLTSVGVGVSQVLPVLVLCLITEPNQVVMIEQPELHLHPAMQLKLADFLLECARTGRQVVVETHSEHIVNRLRLRSMEDPEENGNLVRLLFAEQENGNTVYRSSDVNELGGLDEDWPEGFLDVGANEAASFMRVSIGKMREKKQSK
jgi:energy-coupling factor transporter ATP-binding protein EcfA2